MCSNEPRWRNLGRPIRGYLSSADDKDWFVFMPVTGGRLVGRVTPPEGVELVLTVDDGSGINRPEPKKKPPKSNDIDIPAIAGRRIAVGLARKLPASGDPKSWGLVGLDDPYELKVELRRAP